MPLGQALQVVAPSSSVKVPAGHSWDTALGPPWHVLPVKHGSQAVYLNTGTKGLLVFCGWGSGDGGQCDMTSSTQRPASLSEASGAPLSGRCLKTTHPTSYRLPAPTWECILSSVPLGQPSSALAAGTVSRVVHVCCGLASLMKVSSISGPAVVALKLGFSVLPGMRSMV